jgi:thioredoxin 1
MIQIIKLRITTKKEQIMAFIEVDDDDFYDIFEEESSKGNIVILRFGSEFCEPCYALESELEELDENNNNISILIIDCNESTNLVDRYNVHQTPTMVIYKDKEHVIYNKEGVVLCQDIQKIIDES